VLKNADLLRYGKQTTKKSVFKIISVVRLMNGCLKELSQEMDLITCMDSFRPK
jgi:hypothetical protein